MEQNNHEIELICIIVNPGQGDKITRIARKNGITGATITFGRGTINNKTLCFIGFSETKKELVYMLAEKEKARKVMDIISGKFRFDKANHGIAFITKVCCVAGAQSLQCDFQEGKGEKGMYKSITVIVDKGKGESVIESAEKAGSKGGTIINARGAGIHETSKVFAMEIEPEKEIIIILSEREDTGKIVDQVGKDLEMDKPGNGIIYVQDVSQTYGIFK